MLTEQLFDEVNMEETDPLLENLRAAFADVPKPKKINACGCDVCMNQAECDDLLAFSDKILLALEDEDKADLICRYVSEAIWTVGDVRDFEYFIPKLLELCFQQHDFLTTPPHL